MTRPIPFAALCRMAAELAQDHEDADTIADTLRRLHPTARPADVVKAADRAVAHRIRGMIASR